MPSLTSVLNTGAGIDTAGLITQLVAAERTPRAAALTSRRTTNEARLTAFTQIRAGVSAFSTALSGLIANGTTGVRATSSDAARATLTLTSASAKPVTALLEVERLAARQIIAYPPLPTANGPVGEGSFQVRFGTLTDDAAGAPAVFVPDAAKSPLSITITAANNSLEGVARRINESSAGIFASIVTDTGGARLVLKGVEGAQSAFVVDTLSASATAPLAALSYGVGTTGVVRTQKASDAAFKLDGVTLGARQNRLTGLIDGYDIDLKKAEPGQTMVLQSEYARDDLKNAVTNFVSAYNELNALLADLSRSRTAGSAGGPLQGDATARDVRRQLAGLTTARAATGTAVSSLSDIGVRINRDGTLAVSPEKLAAVVATDPADISALFTGNRLSSSSALKIMSSSAAADGTYRLSNVTAATAGFLSGSPAPTAFDQPVVIDSTNAAFRVRVNGRESLRIDVPLGSYATPQVFAAALDQAIATDPVMASFRLASKTAWTNNLFTMASSTIGDASSVALLAMDPALATRLGLASATLTAGTNASGTIDGVAASGSGNVLTAARNSAAAGLSVQVSSDTPQASLSITSGLGGLLATLASRVSGPEGVLASGVQRLQRSQLALAAQESVLEARSGTLRDRLTRQFGAMDTAVASFKSTQTFLQQQIAIWTNNSNN